MGKLRNTGHWNFEPRTYAMRRSMELRQELLETQMEQNLKQAEKKKLRRSYWWQRLANAMANLKALDPAGWEAWFDSDAVPEYGTEKSRALLVEARVRDLGGKNRPAMQAVARLYKGVFIWRDAFGCFLFDESKRTIEFKNDGEAKAHIDAALALHAAPIFSL